MCSVAELNELLQENFTVDFHDQLNDNILLFTHSFTMLKYYILVNLFCIHYTFDLPEDVIKRSTNAV